MQSKIRAYIEQQFAKAPKTRRIEDLKDELYSNLCDKYEDFLSKGRSEDESFEMAISSIGSIDEMISRFSDEYSESEKAQQRQKNAMMVASCVGLYVLSVIALVSFSYLWDSMAGLIAFLLIAGGATCILVYHTLNKPRYYKQDETLLEKFKEWESTSGHKDENYKTISSIFWLLVVAVYLIISFTSLRWGITWIIFILAAAVQNIIKLLMGVTDKPSSKDGKK